EPARLVVSDPLGLHEREVASGHGGELLVLPRIERVRAPSDGGGGDRDGEIGDRGEGSGARAIEASPVDVEIDGLRPYREGSPASRIHWPVVARTGELIERRLVAGGDRSPLIVLDARDPEDSESLDRAVRAAGSVCVHLARRSGRCALLLPGARRATIVDRELRGWASAHARLAVGDADAKLPALPRDNRGPVIWVSARGQRPRRAEISHFVSPHPLPALAVRFEVAGCYGQTLAVPSRRRAARRVAA